MRINKTKAKLRGGETVLGVAMTFDCPAVVELLGAMGFDYVILNLEPEPYNELSVAQNIRAAEAFDITPIVRIPNDAGLILRLLDAGAQGVHIPNISSAADARRAVDAIRLPPQGRRSPNPTMRSGDYGVGVSENEFMEFSNRETLLILQIEDEEGIRDLDNILAVPDVDAIQFGPKDLRHSMGNPDAALVWQTVELSLRKVKEAGLWGSMVGWIGADADHKDKMARYGTLGVRMITGQLREFIMGGATAFLRRDRS